MPTLPDSGSAPARRPPDFLTVDAMTAGYGAASVVKDVHLTVGRGEVVLLAGPNGAGKSTLMKTLIGELAPTGGHMFFDGREVTGTRADKLAAMGIGYVPQSRDVFDTLKVRENLELGGYLIDPARRAKRIDEVMEFFPILRPLLNRRAAQLSGGERKAVGLARALMPGPSLLVLDEPTAGLSPELGRAVLTEQVRRLADAGVALLVVEQRVVEALAIADWLYVLVGGKIKYEGPAMGTATREDIGALFLEGTPPPGQTGESLRTRR